MTGIETVLLVATAVSGVVGAVGAVAAGNAQRNQAYGQAAIYDYNAKVGQQNARIAREQAAYEALRRREQYRRVLGSQQAAYGKSGVTLSGSALDVMYDSAAQGELDALAAEYSGKVNAASYLSQANMNIYQGQLTRSAGDAARRQGFINAGGTLLSTAASMGSIHSGFSQYSQNTIPTYQSGPQSLGMMDQGNNVYRASAGLA